MTFAESEHDSGFGGDVAVDHELGFFKYRKGALILGTGADEGGEAFDRFEVVVEDVGAGIHDHLQRPIAVVEIGNEDFDDDAGIDLTDRADRFAEMLGSTVFEIVASDGGDDDVFEVHAAGSLGDPSGLIGLQCIRLGGFDGAETAGAGAFVTGDHESGGALSPAFPAVRALGLLADGHQLEIGNQGFGRPEGGIVWKTDLDPRGFLLSMELGIHFHFRAAGGHAGKTKFQISKFNPQGWKV